MRKSITKRLERREGISGYYVFGAGTKKDGTNGFCSCREASDANYFQLRCDQEDRSPSLEYLHDTIDRLRSKYKISDFLVMRDKEPSGSGWHLRPVFGKKQE